MIAAIDLEEKTRIARMASATLHKLHDAMQRMKEWRDDSVKLKSSILRMKMDLQGDSEGDKLNREEKRMDPLITHQRVQISRLERANNDLENQVKSLKQALDRAEGDAAPIREMVDLISRIEEEFAHQRKRLNEEILRLRRRLREAQSEDQISMTHQHQLKDMLLEYAKGDRTIEIVLANAIGRIVETVVSLSEELVYVSEDLCRFKTKNRNLHLKLDRLRAMLRTRCGSASGYRKRIGELSDIAARLLGEMDRLKLICENADQDDDIPDVLAHVERLMSELRSSLRNEREAMIAAGNPDCLKYMRKVIDLRVDLRVLSVELKRSNALIRERPRENVQQAGDCWRTVSLLNDFLRRIDVEIERMRVKPMHKYCRIGGVSGTRYAAKIAELEGIVKRSIGVVAALKHDSAAIAKASDRTTEMLADSIERLCVKIKDLEVLDDRADLRDRIDRLEASAMCLKLELTARDQRIRALNDEHATVRSTLERDREYREKIVADIRAENESLRGDISDRKRAISELSRKSEHLEQRAAAEMQLMRTEINAEKKRLQDLHNDRESLLREKETMRNLLRGRAKELENIASERGRLDAEVAQLKARLEIASDENAKLKSIIADPEMAKWSDKTKDPMAGDKGEQDGRDNGEDTRELRDELERLKAQSNETEISLNEANERIEHLKRALDKAADDRARLEGEISDLKSNEQSLTHRLSARTGACEEATRESERATVENKALANKVKQLRNEKEQLAAQLSEMGSEKGRLARAMADTDNERASLQERVHELKSERNKLQERTSEREATAESLKFQLEMTRVELRDAGVEATRLRSENAKLVGELEMASLRNGGAEERVQALLTEKNELATRINELNGEGAGLRERLNKAEAENEYFSIELNKSRLENDRIKARNALLQVTCDKRERDNGALSMENSTTRQRFNEISSEYRVISNQLGIQQMKYEALRFAAATLYHENNDLKGQLKKIDTRYQLASAHDDVKRKCRDAAFKAELSDRELRTESEIGRGAVHGNRARTRDKPRLGEVKSLAIGNKAWKLELERSENSLKVLTESEPASTKSGSPLTWTEGPTVEEIVGSFLGRHEVINICYKTDTDDYSKYPNDPMILGDEERWSTMVSIDRLEVENAALKMELNVLRNSLNCSQTNGEKTKNELDKMTEEIQALKLELMNLRDEKTALRSRLETFKEELSALRSERAALKDELAASRKSNFDFRLRANDLRAAHEKLKEVNAGLEDRLQDALQRANDFEEPTGSETPNKD